MREQREDCAKCGAKATPRRICPRCGDPEWVYEHGDHYLGGGVLEVITCTCPATNSYRWKQRKKVEANLEKRELAWKEGKNLGGRPPKNRPVTTPEMARRAAENLVNGMKPGPALKAAGFPKSMYKNGKRSINRAIRDEIQKQGQKFIRYGKDLTPEDQAALVRGRLAENVIVGSDAGAMSAKVLGSDKRINLWTPDTAVGMVILSPPPMPVAKHRVEIMPPIERAQPGQQSTLSQRLPPEPKD